MQDKENIDPYEIKYAVPSYYDIYKSGGSTLKDDKQGMRLMLDYFSEYFSEEQLQANMQRYDLIDSKMLERYQPIIGSLLSPNWKKAEDLKTK